MALPDPRDLAPAPDSSMTDPTPAGGASAVQTFFRGPGEMARLTRAHDWAATPLGPVETWPPSLRTTVSTILASRHAMFLWWGPQLIQFYNDAYRQSLGPDRHPDALGAPGRECWAEIWPVIGPEIESIMAGGPSSWHQDHLVPITRGDHVEDVYWSYSYSPVQNDDGSVGGVLVAVQETTARVVSERRAQIVHELAAAALPARSVDDVCDAAAAVLTAAKEDIAFGLVYLDDGSGALRLASRVGLGADHPLAPAALPADSTAPWPVSQALGATGATQVRVTGEPPRFDRWPEPVDRAMVLPLTASASSSHAGDAVRAHGIMILGPNPRLPLDEAAHAFAERVARQVATALDAIERLSDERQLLGRVFELAPAFMAVLTGPDHVFELANPSYRQLVGHRDLIGRSVREVFPEVEGQGFFELLTAVYTTGEPFVGSEMRVELQREPGAPAESRFVNFVYQALRDSSGEITGVFATGVDVTPLVNARRAIERSLAQAEEVAAERDTNRQRLRTVLEQAPIAIAITGPSGEIEFANPAFERLWGRAKESTDARRYSESYVGYHLDGREIASQEWAGARAVLRGELVEGEVIEIVQATDRSAPGRRLTVWISAAPIRDADGRITGGVVMFRDITAERRTEQQLRDAQRVQAVGTLAGGVAHEVNNALQGALGFGSFVLRALGPDHPQSPDMRLVLESVERAARVSQQLLAYARRQITQPERLDLHRLAVGLRPVLQQLLGPDKTLVIAPVSAPMPPVQADPAQVERVLINLVANARDATETGDAVTISFDQVHASGDAPPTGDMGFHLPPGDYLRLSVADTGHGMDSQTLAQVFDPFFTTKPVGHGSGLGLSMVYGTVKQHGGYVGARSDPGAGTTLQLYWPVAEAGAPPAGRQDRNQEAAPGGNGRVVLVVDDEPLVRALAVRALEEEGYTVLAAEDGVAALELLDRDGHEPDAVVTDVIMPRRNGRQLYDDLRARRPDLPLLFISGHTDDQVVLRRLVPLGAPFLQKPFAPAELARAVADLLRSRV